jgi:hypothetical protein
VPPATSADLPCLRTRTELKVRGRTVIATAGVEILCAEIPPAEYAQYRAAFQDYLRATKVELVLTPVPEKRSSSPGHH